MPEEPVTLTAGKLELRLVNLPYYCWQLSGVESIPGWKACAGLPCFSEQWSRSILELLIHCSL